MRVVCTFITGAFEKRMPTYLVKFTTLYLNGKL